jgi:trans-aconitate methyltransferase
LANNGVEVSKIVGYDVSGDMIHFAQVNNTFPNVEFRRANVESEFKDEN